MPDLTLQSTYASGAYKFRALKYVKGALMHGADVYALQTALGVATDGVLGPATGRAITSYQQDVNLAADGIAGGATQKDLAVRIGKAVRENEDLAPGLLYGILEHEAGFQLGNHTSQYPDGSRDNGVAQRNSNFTPPIDAFNVPASIEALATHLKKYYDKYHDKSLFRGDDHSERRRWGLAAGSWNAPAFTAYLAGVRPWAVPGASSLTKIEAYIANVTRYL